MAKTVVTFEGKRYVWTGKRWYGEKDFITPALGVIAELNKLIASELTAQDELVTDPQELVRLASDVRDTPGQGERALKLAQRAFALRPDAVSATVLSSVLRSLGRPAEALEVTEGFKGASFSALLTSRAAAQCDTEQWEEALHTIKRALAIAHSRREKQVGEALSVWQRIKKNAPELFDS